MSTSTNECNTENNGSSTAKCISFEIERQPHNLSDIEKASASYKSYEISVASPERKSILNALRKEKLSQKKSCYTLDTFKSSNQEKNLNGNKTVLSSKSSELLELKKQNIDITIRKEKILNMLREIEKIQKGNKCNKSLKESVHDSEITDKMQDHLENINKSLRESEDNFEKSKKIQNQKKDIRSPSKSDDYLQKNEKILSQNSFTSQSKFVDKLKDNCMIDHREYEKSAIDNGKDNNHGSVIDHSIKNCSLLNWDEVELELEESECNTSKKSEIVSQLSYNVSSSSPISTQLSNIPNIVGIPNVPNIEMISNVSPIGKPFKSKDSKQLSDASIEIKISGIDEFSEVSHIGETSNYSNLSEPTNISGISQISCDENLHSPLGYEEIIEEYEDGETLDRTLTEESPSNYRTNSFPNQTKNLTVDASTARSYKYNSHRTEENFHNFSFSLQAIMEQNNYPHHSQYSQGIWTSQVDDFLNETMNPMGPDSKNAHGASHGSQSRSDSRKSFQSTDPYNNRKSRSPYSSSKHHKKSSKSSSNKRKHSLESSSKSRRPYSRSPSVSSYPRIARYPRDDETNSDWEDDDSHKKDKSHRKYDTKYRTRSKSKERSKKPKKSKKKKSKHSSKKSHRDKPRNDSFSSDFSESEISKILESADKHSSSKQGGEVINKKSSSSSAFNLNDISTLLNKYGEEDQEICETIRKEIIKERALEKESCAKIFKSKIKNRDKGITDDVESVPTDKIEDSSKSKGMTEGSGLNNFCEVADLDVEKFNSDDFWNLLDMELPASELNIEKTMSENVSDSEMSPNQCQDEELPFVQLENEENISPNLLHGQIHFYGKVLELLSSVSNHLGPLEASILSINTEYRSLSADKCKDLLVKNEQLLDTVLKSIEGLIENPMTGDEDLILFEVVRDELNMTMKSIAHHTRLSKCYGLNLNQIASNATEMNPSQIKEFIKHSLLYEGYANIPHKDFSSIYNTVLDIRGKLS